MKVNYEPISPVMGEIVITVNQDDIADDVKKSMKQVAQTANVKGFRAGHVPAALLEKKYGKSVKFDVISKKVGDALDNYIKEEKIDIIGNPIVDQNNPMDLDDAELTYKFKVGLAPKFDLKLSKDVHIPGYDIKVTDQMVDSSIDNLRKQFGEQVPGEVADDNSLIKGVITELNADDSAPLEGGIVQELGIIAPKYFTNADQRKLFEGAKVGAEIIFNPYQSCDGNPTELSSMLNIDKDQVESHKGDFEINIREIIVVKPAELNQDFFDRVLGKDVAHNEEEFRAEVAKRIKNELRAQEAYRFSIDAKNALIKLVGTVELPDEVLKPMLAEENKWPADQVDEIYKEVHDDIVWELLSAHLAQQLGLELKPEDVKATLRAQAAQALAQYGMTGLSDEVLDNYAEKIASDRKAWERAAQRTLSGKLFNAIHAAVTVDQKEVSEEEFAALFRQGEFDATEELG